MSNSQEYRSFAAECVLLSENAKTIHDKLRLLTMAARWQRMADELVFPSDGTTPEIVLVQLHQAANGEPLH